MMHAIMLSTEWRSEQLTDSLLSDACYMIAFDGVVSGRTKCPAYISKGLVYEHDAWAEAAMIALFAQTLDLPPFHIFAEQVVSQAAAERFAILFPHQCLSLTLLAVFPPYECVFSIHFSNRWCHHGLPIFIFIFILFPSLFIRGLTRRYLLVRNGSMRRTCRPRSLGSGLQILKYLKKHKQASPTSISQHTQ